MIYKNEFKSPTKQYQPTNSADDKNKESGIWISNYSSESDASTYLADPQALVHHVVVLEHMSPKMPEIPVVGERASKVKI